MPGFQFMIEVKGLRCPVEGEKPVVGLFIHRRARGKNQQDAFRDASNRLLTEAKIVEVFRMSKENGGSDPRIEISETYELHFWDYYFTRCPKGLGMYQEEASDEPGASADLATLGG